jgi:hypothetical protein
MTPTIDYDALAKHAGAVNVPSVSTPQATAPPRAPAGAVDYDALARQAGAVDVPTPETTPPASQPSTIGKLASGALQLHKDVTTGIGQGSLDTVHGTGELIRKGLNAVPFVNNLGDKVVPPVGQAALDQMATPQNTAQKVGYTAENIAEFMLGDEALKGLSLADKLPKVARAMEVLSKQPILKNQIVQKMIATGVRQGTTGALQGFVHSGGDVIKAAEEGAATGALGATTEGILAGANKMLNSDTVQAILKGKEVAQPGAQAAIRTGTQAATEATGTADESVQAGIQNKPLVEGHATVLDDHLSKLADNEKAAYQKVDEAAGFDVKAEKQQLANDQYKLKQLGNTDADITQKGNLIDAINDSTDRITEAESKMKAAGIDPQAADSIHKQRMAGQNFKKSLIKNTNPADQSVNVQGLLKDAKNLQFSKYGDRLEQFFGSKEAADNYVSQLSDMDKLGAHAMKTQAIAKMVGKYIGLPVVGTLAGAGAFEAIHQK